MAAEFKLDFTNSVAQQHLPKYMQLIKEYLQAGTFPQDVTIWSRKIGVFMVKTNNERDSKKLENKHILFRYGRDKKMESKVRFERQKPWVFYTNPKWITIDGLIDSGLREADNVEFDRLFGHTGYIITPTHEDKDQNGISGFKYTR